MKCAYTPLMSSVLFLRQQWLIVLHTYGICTSRHSASVVDLCASEWAFTRLFLPDPFFPPQTWVLTYSLWFPSCFAFLGTRHMIKTCDKRSLLKLPSLFVSSLSRTWRSARCESLIFFFSSKMALWCPTVNSKTELCNILCCLLNIQVTSMCWCSLCTHI